MAARRQETARHLAAETLRRIEQDEAYSHVVLDAALQNARLEPRDRALATRIVYGTLTWQRAIDAYLAAAMRGPVEQRTDPWVRAVLRSAVYQLRHLDRIPDRAAVNSAVDLVKQRRGGGAAGFANAVLRRIARGDVTIPEPEGEAEAFAHRHSLPDELARRALARFSADEVEAWAKAVNETPPLTVRVVRSVSTMDAVAEMLGAKRASWAPYALHVDSAGPELHRAIKEGRCVVQDEGSQLIVHYVGEADLAGPVWDACAGQGGKTLQILDLLAGADKPVHLTATDRHGGKLSRLSAAAVGVRGEHNLETRVVDLARGAVPDTLHGSFRLVLVDAPCTGFGLLRRHPETRWRRGSQEIGSLAALQANILAAVAPTVAPGGLLLYAVCTDTVEETDAQVDRFLAAHDEFEPEAASATPFDKLDDGTGRLRLWPHVHGTDGFFAARLRRRR